MKTAQKKYRNKSHRIRKAHKIVLMMDFETCGIPFHLPQPFAFEGFKKGEIVVLDANTKNNNKSKMKKPTLTQIRTAVRMGKIGRVYRLYREFTDDYSGINPIEEGCKEVQLERVCTNGLILKFICKTMNISMPLYLYPYKKFVRRYLITKSMKSK